MSAILVDTSGFYAALDSDDSNHAEALSLFGRADSEKWPLMTHSYVVHETWALIQARLGWEAVDAWQRVLLARCEIVWVDEGLHALAAARCRQARQRRLSLTDCVSLELAHRQSLDAALAYGEHLSAAGLRLPDGS
jgi:predicted nucleic acid-binding protein